MCCHPVPHSCMEKIYMSTCRNLLLLPPLCRYTGCHVPVGADWRQHLHISINISIARKWHIRMRAAIRRMRARRACRPVTIYGKEEEKRRKRPKADRRSEFSQALLSFTKNIVCPKLCSERNRLFSSSQKTCFAQSFAQKETGPSFAQSRPPHQAGRPSANSNQKNMTIANNKPPSNASMISCGGARARSEQQDDTDEYRYKIYRLYFATANLV